MMMRNELKVVSACVLSCCAGALSLAEASELTVSPTGLSPQAALEKVRTAKTNGDKSAWTVHVAPGFYELKTPLVFKPEDSGTRAAPVRWIAAGGDAVFAGGGRIVDWRDDGDGTWSAPLPKDEVGKPIWFQSLFVNGRRATRARHPNKGFFQVDSWHQSSETNVTGKACYSQYSIISNAAPDVLSGLTASELAAVEFQTRIKWSYGAFSVTGWDANRRLLTVKTYDDKVVAWKTWPGAENLFCFENVRAGFDSPGEWFYDVTASRIRYRPMPDETLSKLEAYAPTSALVSVVRFEGDLVSGKSVTDISFEGISFALSRTDGHRLPTGFVQQYQLQAARSSGGCIYAKGAERISFERCRIRQTENYAIKFDAGCVSNRVVSCEMTDLGAGGVMIGDLKSNIFNLKEGLPGEGRVGRRIPYGDPLAAPHHPCAFITVDDCLIEHAGLVNPEGCGVLIGQASDCSVTHCDIRDLYYTGISVGWTWGYSGSLAQRNTIAFNRISDLGKGVMSDMGGVYTLGTSFGTCISNNVISDISSHTYGGWGLYNDEGSEGIVWENNVVYDTQDSSYHQHYGRNNIVRNCILACAKKCQLAVSRPEPHTSVTFERNIIYWTDDVPVYHDPMWMLGIVNGKAKVGWSSNIFWCAAGPTVINAAHPAIVADPRFVDAKARDFRLKPDSPAPRFGFKPWDISLSGRRKPSAAQCGCSKQRISASSIK